MLLFSFLVYLQGVLWLGIHYALYKRGNFALQDWNLVIDLHLFLIQQCLPGHLGLPLTWVHYPISQFTIQTTYT